MSAEDIPNALLDEIEERIIEVSVAHVKGNAPKYAGICSAPGTSKVYLAPYNAESLLEYDYHTKEMREIDISCVCDKGLRSKFNGICACGTKIIAAPSACESLLIYDVITGEVAGVDVTSVSSSTTKFYGICAAGTKVFAAPFSSSNMLIYDVEVGKVKAVDISAHTGEGINLFAGICAAHGKVIAAPLKAAGLLIYNVDMDEINFIEDDRLKTAAFKYTDICAIGGNNVLLSPLDAESMITYDLVSGDINSIDISSVVPTRTEDKLNGVCYDPESGLALAVPKHFHQFLLYDTRQGEVRGVTLPGAVESLRDKFLGACFVDGRFFAAPHYSDRMLMYTQPCFKLVLLDIREDFLVCSDISGQELLNVPIGNHFVLGTLRARLLEIVGPATLRFLRAGTMNIINGDDGESISNIFNEI